MQTSYKQTSFEVPQKKIKRKYWNTNLNKPINTTN